VAVRGVVQLLILAVYDASSTKKVDSRSVMLLDVLGCTRTTMKLATRQSFNRSLENLLGGVWEIVNLNRDGDSTN